jgi:hypothetical protein
MRVRWPVLVAFAVVSWTIEEKEFLSASGGSLQRPLGTTAAGGAVEGVVRLNAPRVPGPTRVENTTDPAVCGRSHTLEDLVVSPTTKGVAHAIVALEDAPPERTPPPTTPGRLVFDNRDCRFVPHAAVVTVGSVAEILNSDPTLHTVHLYGPADVNIALPLQGMKVTRRLERPGMVVVKCDVPGWMQAFIRVDQHPFHAVTDTSGAFRITRIPSGNYTLSVWHEKLGTQRRQVGIRDGQVGRVEFDYSLGR